jgi:hemolysin D
MNNPPAKKNTNKNLTLDWNRTELEFLPAALEIVETPPSPIGRALLWIIGKRQIGRHL